MLVKVASTAVVAHCWAHARETINAAVARLGRRPEPAHLPPRAQHRLAQELGRGRRDQPRAVRLALIAKTGEMGYPSVLTAKTWGFYDVSFKGQPFRFQRPYGTYVMENVLFKISYPGRIPLPDRGGGGDADARADGQRARASKTSRKSPFARTRPASASSTRRARLNNPADRDHCIQYMIAVPLLFGRLTAADYEDEVASDPRIDALRAKIYCVEDPQFTRDYHDPDKRSIANALTVKFKDGTQLEGSWSSTRSATGAAARKAFRCWSGNSAPTWRGASPPKQQQAILDLSLDRPRLDATAVDDYVDLYVI